MRSERQTGPCRGAQRAMPRRLALTAHAVGALEGCEWEGGESRPCAEGPVWLLGWGGGVEETWRGPLLTWSRPWQWIKSTVVGFVWICSH